MNQSHDDRATINSLADAPGQPQAVSIPLTAIKVLRPVGSRSALHAAAGRLEVLYVIADAFEHRPFHVDQEALAAVAPPAVLDRRSAEHAAANVIQRELLREANAEQEAEAPKLSSGPSAAGRCPPRPGWKPRIRSKGIAAAVFVRLRVAGTASSGSARWPCGSTGGSWSGPKLRLPFEMSGRSGGACAVGSFAQTLHHSGKFGC